MRTDRQNQASRLNGARSQGPKSPEGKSRSSQNALKHGLTAKIIVLDCEPQSEFETLLAEHVSLFQPRNRVELTLVERMAACLWRSRRGLSIETNALDILMDCERKLNDKKRPESQLLARAYGYGSCSPGAIPSVERYINRLDREYDRTLQLLLKLQQRPSLTPSVESAQNEPELEQVHENQEDPTKPGPRVIPFPSPEPLQPAAEPERLRPPAA